MEVSIPIRFNGLENIDASWFNAIRDQFANAVGWKKYTVTHTQLQIVSMSNDVELFSLAAKSRITGAVIKHSAAATGAGILTYTLSLGIAGNLTKFLPAFNVFQSVSDTAFNLETLDTTFESFSAATSIRAAAVSTGANLDQSTTGSFDIWIRSETLP
jgi:hypothetical protein